MSRAQFRLLRIAVMLAVALLVPLVAEARVTALQIASRGPFLDGLPFAAGPYEKIVGTATFADDPADPHDRAVVDLSRAPRDATGRVISQADVFILAPTSGGNHTALLEVNNRGGKAMLFFFDHARGSPDPTTLDDVGDRFLLDAGYTLVWVGWQWDVPRVPGNMRLTAPVATERGRPISGLVRSDFIVTRVAHEQPLAHRDHVPYPVADPNDPANVLTERDGITAPRRIVARAAWGLNAERTALESTAGFTPGHIYEFVYRARDPVVEGLGFTAVRDVIAFLKYDAGAPVRARWAIGFGISQSARFLRDFLYQGFNVDEANRPVFDGILAHVGGAGRGGFNLRFGQPSRDGPSFSSFFYPVDLFPFTDTDERDPLTGRVDGLLTHAHVADTPVKVMFTETSYEFYGRAASLLQTTADGLRDASLEPNTRIYFFAGGMHYVPPLGARDPLGRQLETPSDHTFAMKALLLDLSAWITDGTPPPPTQIPRIADGTLVAPDRIAWPAIPNFPHTPAYHHVWRLDFGPAFAAGIASIEPPLVGAPFPVLVPQVDADGIDRGGIRMPEVAVPVATFTGWNQRIDGIGFADENVDFAGSFVPFARTADERRADGDPRPSLAERYRSESAYLAAVAAAARDLVARRLLLAGDVEVEVRRARRFWDFVMQPAPAASH